MVQKHLMQRQLAGYWGGEGNPSDETKTDPSRPRNAAWNIAAVALTRCEKIQLFPTWKQPEHVTGTVQQLRVVVVLSTGTRGNGDNEPNYWSGEMFPLCQPRRMEASLARCHGLTSGLQTRVRSLAPLRTQLSCRNAGYGVNPAKSRLLPN